MFAVSPVLAEDSVVLSLPFGGAVLQKIGVSRPEIFAILEDCRRLYMEDSADEADRDRTFGLDLFRRRESEDAPLEASRLLKATSRVSSKEEESDDNLELDSEQATATRSGSSERDEVECAIVIRDDVSASKKSPVLSAGREKDAVHTISNVTMIASSRPEMVEAPSVEDLSESLTPQDLHSNSNIS